MAASVAAYGSVLGMLAAQKGLAWTELLAMNLSIFAGSAQFVMVEMWAPPLPVVMTTRVETQDVPIQITGEGTVKPLQETNLVPQVDGKVIEVASSMVNGGEFRKGELLLRIDPIDYQLAVTQKIESDPVNVGELVK